MPKPNLSRMNVEALMDLRKRVDEMLVERRVELQKQLESIALLGGEGVLRARGGGSTLKGRKAARTHRSLDQDAPVSRPVQQIGRIVSHALLGGLHHQYVRI